MNPEQALVSLDSEEKDACDSLALDKNSEPPVWISQDEWSTLVCSYKQGLQDKIRIKGASRATSEQEEEEAEQLKPLVADETSFSAPN